eukprot:4294151-Amphidinium_carterae.1
MFCNLVRPQFKFIGGTKTVVLWDDHLCYAPRSLTITHRSFNNRTSRTLRTNLNIRNSRVALPALSSTMHRPPNQDGTQPRNSQT